MSFNYFSFALLSLAIFLWLNVVGARRIIMWIMLLLGLLSWMFPKGENGNTGPFHPLMEEGLDAGDPRLTARIWGFMCDGHSSSSLHALHSSLWGRYNMTELGWVCLGLLHSMFSALLHVFYPNRFSPTQLYSNSSYNT